MKTLLAALTLLVSACFPAQAQTWQDFGTVGWWHIGYNTDDDGCGFYASYTNNVSLRLNVHADDTGDFVLMLPGKVLTDGNKYKISTVFDGRTSWDANIVAHVETDQGITFTALITTVPLKFLQAVSRSHNITVYLGKKQITQLLLTGSQEAFGQALQCKDLRKAQGNEQQQTEQQPPTQSAPQWSTGTGFAVSKGNVVTANHVVKECTHSIKMLQGSGAISTNGRVLRQDDASDLAVIGADDLSVERYAEFRIIPAVRAGESVAVFGYPLSGTLASTGNVVAGYVTSLAGIGNNASQMQISAPIAPGDSGGAVLDQSGNAIGMVVSFLAPTASYTPQNINFALKASAITTFLDANSITYKFAAPVNLRVLQLPELADLAKTFTVAIECQ